MWYGLSKRNFVRTLAVFAVIGLVAALLGLLGAGISGMSVRNYRALVWLVLGIPAIWVVLASILSATWLKVGDADISWYLWKRVLILTCPIDSVLAIGPGSFSAVVIRTRQGTIRLFGLHLRDRAELIERLMKVKPNIDLAR